MGSAMTASQLIRDVKDARRRTLELIQGLSGEQLMGPRLSIVNPLLWEIGHVAWFHERWILRHLDGQPPLLANADALYDSIAIPHDVRWDLPLPPLAETLSYMAEVLEALAERLCGKPMTAADAYFYQLTIYHEDMHDEAFTYTRQTLGYSKPEFAVAVKPSQTHNHNAGPLPGDVEVPGGTFMLGADPAEPYVFDNEKWAHGVELTPFRIARAPVTNEEFARFAAAGGYQDPAFWSPEGWRWREQNRLDHPLYWIQDATGDWYQRRFDTVIPLAPYAPVIHVSWFEADAYCRWASRRLPTEAEWEVAAAGEFAPSSNRLAPTKRRFPWGNVPPTPEHANLDGRCLGPIDVAALPAGDSAFGCRQMIGNVWEWTATTFGPYPGFVADPYKEYSEPWFWTHKVLRGGCWATRSRLLRNTWRNFYTPERNDVFAGFRTCALD